MNTWHLLDYSDLRRTIQKWWNNRIPWFIYLYIYVSLYPLFINLSIHLSLWLFGNVQVCVYINKQMEIERDKGERKSRRRKRMKRKRTGAVGEARGRNKEDERKKGRESHIKMIRQLPHNNCSSYSFTQSVIIFLKKTRKYFTLHVKQKVHSGKLLFTGIIWLKNHPGKLEKW